MFVETIPTNESKKIEGWEFGYKAKLRLHKFCGRVHAPRADCGLVEVEHTVKSRRKVKWWTHANRS